MAAGEARNFRYLNAGSAWPGFSFAGVDLAADGTLSLSPLAQLIGDMPPGIADLSPAAAPGGVASDPDGNLYWSDPDRNRIYRRLACDGTVEPLSCFERAGAEAGPLRSPRGLVVPPHRDALFIVDSGNSRVLAIEPTSQQLLAVWPGSAGRNPAAGAAPGAFNTPWAIAAAHDGSIFVLDRANRCVQKLGANGDWDRGFFDRVRASGLLVDPVDVAVTAHGAGVRVLIADTGAKRIVLFDGDGNPERDAANAPRSIALDPAIAPMGLAATRDALFLGDNARRRILQFQLAQGDSFGSAAEVRGYHGPVSALAIASAGTLIAYAGAGAAAVEVAIGRGVLALGAAWSGVIDLGYPVKWNELVAEFAPLDAGAHVDVFAYASADPNDRPVVANDPTLHTFFADPRWQRQFRGSAVDVNAVYIGNAPGMPPPEPRRYLWVGVELRSDGDRSPGLENLRVEFNQSGYMPLLPAIYAADTAAGDFLPRLLTLFQGFFEGVETEISTLARLFDPALAPQGFLDWLAGWLGVELYESWPEAKRRQAIAEAFAWFARRGTRRGLEHAIEFATGIPAIVEEPIVETACWCLPEGPDACCHACASESTAGDEAPASGDDSVLGCTTVLAPSQPDGAIVGTTAVLDQSQLIRDDEFGSPLFSDVAYQFSVLVPRSALASPGAVERLRAVVDAAMPAHTTYQICAIDALMRVGYQARVGVDTMVGGPPPSMRLGDGSSLGETAALGGPPPVRLDGRARIGIGARIE